jgi:hypothetical protein
MNRRAQVEGQSIPHIYLKPQQARKHAGLQDKARSEAALDSHSPANVCNRGGGSAGAPSMQHKTSADAVSHSHTHEGQSSRRKLGQSGAIDVSAPAGDAGGSALWPLSPPCKPADAHIRDAPRGQGERAEARVDGGSNARAKEDELGPGTKRELLGGPHDVARGSKRQREESGEVASAGPRDRDGAVLQDTRASSCAAEGGQARQGGGLARQSTARTGDFSQSLRTRVHVALAPYRKPDLHFSRWPFCVHTLLLASVAPCVPICAARTVTHGPVSLRIL